MTDLLLHPAAARLDGALPDRSVRPLPGFRAVSDPLRWELLGHLCRRGEMPRSDLQRVLRVTRTTLTYHIRALVQAGLVETSGTARSLTYAVRWESLAQLRGWLGDPRSAGQGE